MGGATRWGVLAKEAGFPLSAEIVTMPAADLHRRIAVLARQAAVIVVDSPPPGNCGAPAPATRAGNQRRETSVTRVTVTSVLIGYGRVSTAEQNPAHQIDALTRAGAAERGIHIDTASGAKASRPKLDLVLQLLREGDTLVITRLDRLSRSVLHLITLGAELRERGIGLKVTEQGIDTTTAEGRAMFGMLSVLAELQRELIVANSRDGLAAARARGRTGGRRPMLTPDQAELAQQLYDARSKTVQQIAAMFGVPRTTVYGHLGKNTVGTRPRAARRG